jgi:SAM-dependent methyltransferase
MFANLEITDPGVTLRAHIPGDWRRPSAGEEFDLYWRDADGFGQLLPRPTLSQINAFYEIPSYYDKEGDVGASARGRSFAWRLLQNLAWRRDMGKDLTADWCRRTADGEKRRCVEIGCSNGTNLLKLRNAGHEAIGVESDPVALGVTRGLGFEAYAGTAEDLPEEIKGQTFDWVFIIHALEHCLDPVLAVRNALDLVKDDGQILIEVPNNQAAGARIFGDVWFWLDVPRHLNFFTPKSLVALVKDCGLEPEALEYTGFNRQFGVEWVAMQVKAADALHEPKPGILPYIRLLLSGAFARDEDKYDSVRIVARKPAIGATA